MAWKGRTDLEKEMRKANDRLRRLEASGNTGSQAYKEALRQMRLASGDPNQRVPRFRRSDYSTEADLRKAMKQFMGSKTSTVAGINKQWQKTAKTISERHEGVAPSSDVAKAIGNVWEGIRQGTFKYNQGTDTAIQETITEQIAKGRDPDGIAEVINELMKDKIPLDEWEKKFDVYWDELIEPPEPEEEEPETFTDVPLEDADLPPEWLE